LDPFVATILVIFSITLVISYVKSTIRDRCLKDFNKFSVVVLLKNGKSVWGRMKLKSSGFILEYSQPYDNISHFEHGFIIYRNEFSTFFGVFRMLSELSDKEQKLRKIKKDIAIFKPLLWLKKKTRNFFAAVRDAFVDTFSMFLGKYGAKSSLISQNQKYVKNLGTTVIDYIGNSYDPILEELIGKRVVYEILQENIWREYTGTLKNYSKDFLEILDTEIPLRITLKLRENQKSVTYFNIEIVRKGNQITVKNKRDNSVKLISSDKCIQLNPEQEIKVSSEKTEDTFLIEFFEKVDGIFPRSEAVVRHLAE